MSELRKLREAVYDLATNDDLVLDDEAWYNKLWELLDPVIDARAERSIAAKAAARAAAKDELPPWAKGLNPLPGLHD